jgi:hypothetical protein
MFNAIITGASEFWMVERMVCDYLAHEYLVLKFFKTRAP